MYISQHSDVSHNRLPLIILQPSHSVPPSIRQHMVYPVKWRSIWWCACMFVYLLMGEESGANHHILSWDPVCKPLTIVMSHIMETISPYCALMLVLLSLRIQIPYDQTSIGGILSYTCFSLWQNWFFIISSLCYIIVKALMVIKSRSLVLTHKKHIL